MTGQAMSRPCVRPHGRPGRWTCDVDFVGDNRVIFDLGGNKYRLIVHVSFTFGRVLVKFIGSHAEYDRIDPETVSWRKK
jgi:mRNA interferase HigB